MRISKQTHLKRLLQTQDVLIAALLYALTLDGLWLIGEMSLEQVLNHLYQMPIVLLLGIFAANSREPKLHGESVTSNVAFAFRFAAFVGTGLLVMVYINRTEDTEFSTLGIYAALLFAALFFNRGVLRWWYLKSRREQPHNYLKVLIIGNGPRAAKLIDTYRRRSEWGVDVVGVLDPTMEGAGDEGEFQTEYFKGAPILGGLERIQEILANTVIDEVIVCLPRSLLNDLQGLVAACQEEAVCVKFLADIYDVQDGTIRLDAIGSLPTLSFEPRPHDEGMLVVKRIVDLSIALLLLIVLAPLFAIVALAIKLDSAGPVFFVQSRVGLNKRNFGMIKFRSMERDAEQRLEELEHLNEADGPIFKIQKDPRVTRVGRFLRRTSLDELPQLINVLLGHMSLVGPRPMSLRDVTQFSLGVQRRRFSVRPGVACLREVSGRSRLSFEQWLELDLKYIEEWSLWLDLKILFKLIPSVLRRDGAC